MLDVVDCSKQVIITVTDVVVSWVFVCVKCWADGLHQTNRRCTSSGVTIPVVLYVRVTTRFTLDSRQNLRYTEVIWFNTISLQRSNYGLTPTRNPSSLWPIFTTTRRAEQWTKGFLNPVEHATDLAFNQGLKWAVTVLKWLTIIFTTATTITHPKIKESSSVRDVTASVLVILTVTAIVVFFTIVGVAMNGCDKVNVVA